MQLFSAKILAGHRHRMPFKSATLALTAVLAGSLAIAGCSTGYNVAETQATSVTKVGYGLPAKTTAIAKADDMKAPRTQRTPRVAATKSASSSKSAKMASANYLGRAPYICTPSGFGSKTRCFNRS